MPLYDYRCKSCGNEFEALVFGKDLPLCPNCKGDDLEKLMSSFTVGSAAGKTGSSSSKCSGCSGRSCSTCR